MHHLNSIEIRKRKQKEGLEWFKNVIKGRDLPKAKKQEDKLDMERKPREMEK